MRFGEREYKGIYIFHAWFGLNVESITRAPKARAKFWGCFWYKLDMNALFIDTAITLTRSGTYTPYQQEILPVEAAAPAQIQAVSVLFAPEARENFQFSSSDCSTETLFYGV